MDTATLPRGIACGHCKGRHATVAQVRSCPSDQEWYEQQGEQERAAELAGLRALENAGYEAARAQEWYDQSRGAIW